MADSDRSPAAVVRLDQCLSARYPVLSLCASILASLHSMRWTSCSFPISRLKMAVGVLPSIEVCAATLRAKAVFPIDGRPAMTTRSAFWKPEVSASRSSKPDAMPVTCCFLS